MHPWVIAGTAFLACAVEMVEALTIVVAVGVARGWRAALLGAATGIAILALIVAVGRPLLLWLEPLPAFHIAVGAVALYYGWGWLKKAVLRAAGRKALHDETAIYERNVAELERATAREAFVTSLNGVFIEGVEVVVIVLAFGAGGGASLLYATLGAVVALALVVAAGVALHRPLATVPENAMKFVVGVMLTAFGVFWIGQGLGVRWWLDDGAPAFLAPLVLALALIAVRGLRPRTGLVSP